MRALFLRELRRLAPYGVGLFLLMIALAFLPFTHDAMHPWNLGGWFVCAAVGLLAVAAVAPDTQAGGTAFLLRLPVRPLHVIALKALAAGLCALPVVLAFLAVVAGSNNDHRTRLALGGFGLVFGCGLLGSVLCRKALPAIVATPGLMLLALVLALVVPTFALDLDPDVTWAALVMTTFAAACGGAAVLAFARGEPHRPSARPALLAAAVLAPLLVASFAATAAARAWTFAHVLPRALRVRDAARAGDRHLVLLQGDLWTGTELRAAVVEDDRAWLVPARNPFEPEVSPDGRRVLLRAAGEGGGWLVDLEARTTTPLPGLARQGFGFPHVLWTRDGAAGVLLLRQAGEGPLEAFAPWPVDAPCQVDAAPRRIAAPRGARLVGTTIDGRALLADGQGLLTIEVAGASVGAVARLPWPEGLRPQEVATSPRRGRAVVLDAGDGVHVVDLATGGAVRLVPPGAGGWRPRVDRRHVTFSPDEARVALSLGGEHVAAFDARTGACLDLSRAPRPVAWPVEWVDLRPTWTEDGAALALPWGTVTWFGPHAGCERAGAHAHGKERVVAFEDPRVAHGLLHRRRLAWAPVEGEGPERAILLETGGGR